MSPLYSEVESENSPRENFFQRFDEFYLRFCRRKGKEPNTVTNPCRTELESQIETVNLGQLLDELQQDFEERICKQENNLSRYMLNRCGVIV